MASPDDLRDHDSPCKTPTQALSATISSIASESPTQSPVLVAKSTPIPVPATDPDEALRTAIKVALDAGDLARATALLEVLRATPKPAAVLTLAVQRERR